MRGVIPKRRVGEVDVYCSPASAPPTASKTYQAIVTHHPTSVMARLGLGKVFVAITVVDLMVCVLSVLVYIFGERVRGLVVRSAVGQRLLTYIASGVCF